MYELLFSLGVLTVAVWMVSGADAHGFWRGMRRGVYLTASDDDDGFNLNAPNLGRVTCVNRAQTVQRRLRQLTAMGYEVQITKVMMVAKRDHDLLWATVFDNDLLDAAARLYCEAVTDAVDTDDPAEWSKVKHQYLPQPPE